MSAEDTKCLWCGRPEQGINFNKTFCSTKCRTEYEQNTGKSTGWGSSCFVATAVYQNENHPVIDDLRSFRDKWLDKRKLGKKFIVWYYSKGPVLAAWVDKSKVRKFLTLFFLIKPLHYFIKLLRLHK